MSIELTIVTPDGERYHGDVESVVLPGSEGEFGVLPDHERFLAPLRIGSVEIQTGGQTQFAVIGAGFADVSAESVVVLVDACDLAADIDVADAESARERAEKALAELNADEDTVRYREFETALEHARARIEVGSKRS